MNRRDFHTTSLLQLLTLTAWSQAAYAISLKDLTGEDASSALKAALEKGAISAVGMLGVAIDIASFLSSLQRLRQPRHELGFQDCGG